MTFQLTPGLKEREAATGRPYGNSIPGRGNSIPGRGNSMYQAPKVEISSVDTRTGKVVGEFPGGPVVRTWHFHC